MSGSSRLDSLIDGVYDAALDAARWPKFLSALAGALNGTLPTLFLHDPRAHAGALSISVGYGADVVEAYKQYYAERNVWLRSGADKLRPGRVRTSHMMCPRRDFLRSEWYGDYCRRLAITQGIGATIHRDGPVTANIAVFAGDSRAPFDAQEMRLLGALLPHLQRAVKLHTHLVESELRNGALADAVDGLAAGVLLVAASGKVLFMNRAAQRLTSARDGLLVDGAGLKTLRSNETAVLRSLIGSAAQTSVHRGTHAGGTLRVRRPHGRVPLEVVVSPISTKESWCSAERAVAVIFVTDPTQVVAAPEDIVASLYGLTPAEARVAISIALGITARQAADELGISYNTVKTHLKRIFEKTDTRRQGDLVRLIGRAWLLRG